MTRRGTARPPLALVLAGGAVVALLLLPLAYLVVRASEGGAWGVLARARTVELVWSTLLLVAGVVAASVLVAVPLAWLVTRTDVPLRRIWAVAAALPLVIPSYVAALALLAALGPRGLLADALGVDRLPEIRGYAGALVALTLATYPYVYLLVASALRDADPALEEAARSVGRSPWRTFFRVTLPSVRPALGGGALLVALYVLSDFGVVSLMNYDALTRAIFLHYRSLFDRTPAAVLALVLVALTAAVLALEWSTRPRGRAFRSGAGSARPHPIVQLGRWRYAAFAYCALVLGTFLALPIGVLLYWLTRGRDARRPVELPWTEAVNSVSASALAALIAVVAALPLAILAVRFTSRWTRLLERAAYASNALPGIVIALALVFFATRYASPLYQTLTLLVAAYVIRFLPQALAAADSALGRISPRLEEAARGLGRRPARAFASITLPVARGGLAAGAALVFLSAMKELPATLLLRPIGFDTLATEIWTQTSIAAYSRAAPSALALIVLSTPLLFLLWRDRGPSSTTAD